MIITERHLKHEQTEPLVTGGAESDNQLNESEIADTWSFEWLAYLLGKRHIIEYDCVMRSRAKFFSRNDSDVTGPQSGGW